MSNLTRVSPIESALIEGDLSKLNENERLSYYKQVCESLGLNPLTQPFGYIRLNGKLTLYAKRDATDQIRAVHKVSINITAREQVGDVYIVTARARNAEGREDESTGAVSIAGLKGEALANAFLKAETKSKRRVTLSICGLGILDESEASSIPDAQVMQSQENPRIDPVPKPILRQVVVSDDEYTPSFGKFKGQKLKDLDIFDLNSYVAYIEKSAEENGKEIKGAVKEFMDAAMRFLESRDYESNEPINESF